jgi:hypothetical protein
MPAKRTSRITGGRFARNPEKGRILRKGLTVSTALHVRQSKGEKNNFYVLGKISENGPRVLCLDSASGIKTLPIFSKREAARRFLRATPLRFGLLASGWRPRRILGSELGSLLLFGLPANVRVITLDLSPEALVGDCSVEPLSEVAWRWPRWVAEGSPLKTKAAL